MKLTRICAHKRRVEMHLIKGMHLKYNCLASSISINIPQMINISKYSIASKT